MQNSKRCYIITGISGSGKTTTLKAFEDMGYYCIDNIPTVIIPTVVKIMFKDSPFRKLAIGVDIRERLFLKKFPEVLKNIKSEFEFIKIIFLTAKNEIIVKRYKETRRVHPLFESNLEDAIGVDIRERLFLKKFPEVLKNIKSEFEFIKIIFLTAKNEIIVKRYKETRRVHPLFESNLEDAIETERKVMDSLIKSESDFVIDTSKFNVHALRKYIYENFGEGNHKNLRIDIVSFGFKNGGLIEGDLVFDVRFLPNPYFEEALKDKDGRDKEVVEYVFGFSETEKFYSKLKSFIEFLLPKYEQEGKPLLVIGIGCTGGKHRSVVIASKLYDDLKKIYPHVYLRHRDL